MKTKNIFGLFSILLLLLSIVPLASAANVDVALQWVLNGDGMGIDKEMNIDVGETISYQVAANSFAKYNLEVILLDENKNVLIGIREIDQNDNNPYDPKEVKINIENELSDLIEVGRVKVMVIPDIESVNYGRGVGYEIIEHVPPKNVGEISATKIRKKLFNK